MGFNTTLIEHLKTVLHVLEEAQIPYALAGGLAYSALVEPRATLDIDLLIMLAQHDIQPIIQCLELHFDTVIAHQKPMRFRQLCIWRVVSVKNQYDIILDFLLAESPFHQSALKRASVLEVWGMPIRMVRIEDLVLLKQCADRPQDRVDLARIAEVFKDRLDHAYLAYWTDILQLQEHNKKTSQV